MHGHSVMTQNECDNHENENSSEWDRKVYPCAEILYEFREVMSRIMECVLIDCLEINSKEFYFN